MAHIICLWLGLTAVLFYASVGTRDPIIVALWFLITSTVAALLVYGAVPVIKFAMYRTWELEAAARERQARGAARSAGAAR